MTAPASGGAPLVLGLVPDLVFGSRVAEAAGRLGYGFRVTRSVAELSGALAAAAPAPRLVVMDLTARGVDCDAALAAVEAHGAPAVLGWTTHVAWRETRRLHARCAQVVTREQLTAELPALLRRHVEGRAMDSESFVRELDARNQELLRRLEPAATLESEAEGDLSVANLLKIALKNEIEASESAARWMATTPELDVKLALARQVGDEAKHYRLIAERLGQLGVDLHGFDPLARGYGPLFRYLDSLTTTVERVAAGQFTREAIAVVKNRQFIEFCEAAGDAGTARLYREIIEPDEHHHHELGRRLLLRYATTPETQEAARRAAARTLELAEELQALALQSAGIHHAPGC
jgi:1,2-phenylacetyl-CoA epoxidase catalytic subunit